MMNASCHLLKQLRSAQKHSCCCFQTSAHLGKNIRTGVPKITPNRSKPLNYEQAQKPGRIGVTKYWNSANTSNLYIEKEYERWLPRSAETAIDDAFLRRFVTGIFQGMVYGEIIIKRQWNTINVSLLILTRDSGIQANQPYFLKGFSETLLSHITKCVVKVDLQSVPDPSKLIFKKI